MCLGPGPEIQGTGSVQSGSLFCRKIGLPICWDFFADFGGRGGCKYSLHPPPPLGGRIRPTSPICSADLLGFWIFLIRSADFQTAGTLITAHHLKAWAHHLKARAHHLKARARHLKAWAHHLKPWAHHLKAWAHHLKAWARHLKSWARHFKAWARHFKAWAHHLKAWAHHLKARAHHLKAWAHHSKAWAHHLKARARHLQAWAQQQPKGRCVWGLEPRSSVLGFVLEPKKLLVPLGYQSKACQCAVQKDDC